MKEKNLILLVCGILFIVSVFLSYFYFFKTDFNFYESRIEVNGNEITETLHFKPDKDYHTLFRTFKTDLTFEKIDGRLYRDMIELIDVKCSNGKPYAKVGNGCKYFDGSIGQCMAYTMPNEYGCGFGDEYGFKKGREYMITAKYNLYAENIFKIDGRNYIKFVVYTPKDHIYLTSGRNLIINGDTIHKNTYYPKENVIIYVPYNGAMENKKVNLLNVPEYDRQNNLLLFILISILPSLLVFTIWFLLGREKHFVDLPESMSYPPNERKAWEVAAFFSPPFNVVDKNFFSALLLDLYHRKIIDIKIKEKTFGKSTLIKINDDKLAELDKVEREFMSIFIYIRENAKEKYVDDGYVDYASAAKSFLMRREISSRFRLFDKKVKKEGKNYVSTIGNTLIGVILVILVVILFLTTGFIGGFFIFSLYVIYFLIRYLLGKSALFTKHKESYYIEYQHWQAFKKHIERAPSIKHGDYRAVAIWTKYLVYALALGVPKRILKQLADKGIINQTDYDMSMGCMSFSSSFSTSTGTGGSGGGFGGGGGGGVGGGGGGGR